MTGTEDCTAKNDWWNGPGCDGSNLVQRVCCRLRASAVVVLAVLMAFGDLPAQTCCSGGVPLSSNLGLPPSESATLQVRLSYDLNVLETLIADSEVLDDDSRTRRTHSALLGIGYSFNDRLSLDGLFSWVRQERRIDQFGNRDLTSTQGIGDAVFLLKCRALELNAGRTLLTTAVGVKAPLGAPDLRRDDGLPIIADLQPGSGAWDGILWMQWVQTAGFRPSLSFSATVTAGFKGKNPEYLNDQTYQFGNELQILLGLSDRLFVGNSLLDPSLSVRYRTVRHDRIDGERLPSTGGQWVFLNPGVTYWLTADWSFNANVELPLHARVEGTQVSPTYRLHTGFFFRIPLKKKFTINPSL